jgi:hypothetical protein
MRTLVIVTHAVIGFHLWHTAPPSVGYLASYHRHLFQLRVEASVGSGDREIEFHTLKQALMVALFAWPRYQDTGAIDFGGRSCEHIAKNLLETVGADYPITAVEVWEDGECGARVEP